MKGILLHKLVKLTDPVRISLSHSIYIFCYFSSSTVDLSSFSLLYWPLSNTTKTTKPNCHQQQPDLEPGLDAQMDFSSKSSSFYQSTSDYSISHPSSTYAASSSSGAKRRDEELQGLIRGIFTETRVLTCEK
jgi:hypothetical protein